MPTEPWASASHALLVGHIYGALLRLAAEEAEQGEVKTHIEPVTDERGFTNQIKVKRPSGEYLITVEALSQTGE